MHPRSQLASLGVHAKKRFGQNFLTSPHWAHTLVDTLLEEMDPVAVWEIGPGLGALTDGLLKKSPVAPRLFEIDRNLCGFLRERFPNVDLVEGDFLKWEPTEALERILVLGNLPYNVSSPIFFKLLDWKGSILRMVLTFQREFARRLVAKPTTPDYGGTSVVAQTFYELHSLGVIPPGAFYPKPEVDSEAICFEPRPDPQIDRDSFLRLVREAFSHRRKMLLKNLGQQYGKDKVLAAFEAMQISPKVRAEELSPPQFLELAERLIPTP
ncbi:MAG: ribosomal RNA small subunit methyltransferase A [Bdellovibrionaceae bacterium]|nr:ribosomal RNA small subunit methyltransferase A [Bdellovibrionales bacterium]MCB9254122.1 ribosomal RNA small subunit methyltransferase A [Pseudobdellovibrionaceae bacterium]